MIVVNTTYQIAPWADALFALDVDWWKTYIKDVQANFEGKLLSSNSILNEQSVYRVQEAASYGNSGAAAIASAFTGGAKRVVMIGYDCQRTNGKAHWHGDHPKHLGNAGKIELWHEGFERIAKRYSHCEIVNASRETALKCFKQMSLEDALWQT